MQAIFPENCTTIIMINKENGKLIANIAGKIYSHNLLKNINTSKDVWKYRYMCGKSANLKYWTFERVFKSEIYPNTNTWN